MFELVQVFPNAKTLFFALFKGQHFLKLEASKTFSMNFISFN